MKLENQVVSLELAQKLKSLNVKQESLFWWDDHTELGMGEIVSFDEPDNPICSAYNLAELGEMLPSELLYGVDNDNPARSKGWTLEIEKNYLVNPGSFTSKLMKWAVYYKYCEYEMCDILGDVVHTDNNEVDARAKMLIYLIEQGLVDVTKLEEAGIR